MPFPFPISFFHKQGEFSYSDTFGADLFEWWRLDLGVTLSTTNVKTVEGQHQGIILGNPDLGVNSYPLFVAESSNLNNRPVARWDDAPNNNLTITFGSDLTSPHCLLQVCYIPSWVDTNAIANGPIFGSSSKFYSIYRSTEFRIWDGNTADQVVGDDAENWEIAVAMICIMDGSSSRIHRNGGTNLRASGQTSSGVWNGIAYGTAVFSRAIPADFELAEVAVLSGIPSNTALNKWVNYVGTRYNLSTSPIS